MNTSHLSRIFVSSVQKELADERRALKAFVNGDALLRRFFEVFLFEDLPASDRRADDVYLDEVDRCAIYVGIFGNEYGAEGADGLSPVEREFVRATVSGKARFIFVKGEDDAARHPKMRQLVRKAGDQVIRRRFNGTAELTAQVYASCVDFLQDRGIIRNRAFDDTVCLDATIDDIDHAAVTTFVRQARDERQFPFDQSTPAVEVLTHLGLLREDRPTNAAMLLFGRNPQQFIPCAEVRCMHFHGTEIQRPAPFYRIFKGTLFSQVDQAANFVLSVTNLSVGTRALGAQAPVGHEIPPDVVREAVVNAVAHRDYASGAAIQVSVFADRVEVWNPGELPPPLTPESLRHPHRSVARNHRICEALFLAGYIEKYGTGTLMMIRESLSHSLPEPKFQQRGGEFSAVIGRDWLTEQILLELNLNDRQSKAVLIAKKGEHLDNKEYQKLFSVSKPTASRDLDALAAKGVLAKIGTTGKGTHYVLGHKGLIKGSMGSNSNAPVKGSQRAQWAQAGKRDTNRTNETFSQSPVKTQHITGRKTSRKQVGVDGVAGQTGTKSALSRHQVGPRSGRRNKGQATAQVEKVLSAANASPKTHEELLSAVGVKHREHFRKAYVDPLLKSGLIERTIPDKPTSRLQKYRTTEKGRTWLAERKQ